MRVALVAMLLCACDPPAPQGPPQPPPGGVFADFRAADLDPQPQVVPRSPAAIRVALRVVAPKRACQDYAGGCVDDIGEVFRRGLSTALAHYATLADQDPHDAVATFTLTTHASKGEPSFEIYDPLTWSFVLIDAAGRPIVELGEHTPMPADRVRPHDPLRHMDETAANLTRVVEGIVERIANALNAAHWP